MKTPHSPQRSGSLLQKLAGTAVQLPVIRRGAEIWQENAKDFYMPLSKSGKLLCGGWLILRDFSLGVFPPRFEDQATAYDNEAKFHTSLPGLELDRLLRDHMAKPF